MCNLPIVTLFIDNTTLVKSSIGDNRPKAMWSIKLLVILTIEMLISTLLNCHITVDRKHLVSFVNYLKKYYIYNMNI